MTITCFAAASGIAWEFTQKIASFPTGISNLHSRSSIFFVESALALLNTTRIFAELVVAGIAYSRFYYLQKFAGYHPQNWFPWFCPLLPWKFPLSRIVFYLD